ncbi:MAG: glycosyltransferase [Betaproteobacteria bacterium]|nr:MAG: glycosyltransferase [Betaproteobacteria bacterium]
MFVRVSVVVPTCGRPELLARCLAALEKQTLPREEYELIVVDDSGRSGPAAARNRGCRKARAEIVAFTDDDTEPTPGWLECGLRAFDSGADAVSGRIVMPISGDPTDYERDAHGLERSEFVTANCFVRKSVLERIGGFDETFRMAWREDSDLHFRLLQCGARVVRSAQAVVVHPVRPAPWGVSVKQQRKVMFDALLFKKHRRLYRQRIRAGARWDYYLITAALVLTLAGVWPAALVWLAFTGRFCAQRLRGASKRPAHVLEMALTSMAIPPLAVFWRLAGMLRYRVAFL